MEDTLQENAEISEEVTNKVETETGLDENSNAELATATEEKQEKAIDGAQKAINKQHAKFREEERKRISIETERDELKKKLDAVQEQRSVIPANPDPYDEDYEAKMTARDEAIKQQAIYEAQKTAQVDSKQRSVAQAEQLEQERVRGLANSYDKRAIDLGLDSKEVADAGSTIVEYGISQDVAEFILGHESGPLIAKYLSDNLLVLDELQSQTPIQAAFTISNKIVPKFVAQKTASNAPDPTEVLSGNGAGEKTNPFLEGATFS